MNYTMSFNNALYYTYHKTPYGHSLIACTHKALVHIKLRPDHGTHLSEFVRLGYQPIEDENAITIKVCKQVDEYFSGKRKNFQIPLQLHGTEFQNQVWNVLTDVPFGQMVSYGELAAMVNHPRAARAVGSTMAKNHIPIVIPCHRVVPASRKVGNYTGGVDIKYDLLQFEGINMERQAVKYDQ